MFSVSNSIIKDVGKVSLSLNFNAFNREIEATLRLLSKSLASGLGGTHLDEASPLVFSRHFSDLDSSLNVASISLSISITVEVDAVCRYRADRK